MSDQEAANDAPRGAEDAADEQLRALQREHSRKERERLLRRRDFLLTAGATTAIAALGGLYILSPKEEQERRRLELRDDGKSRLPPGQEKLEAISPELEASIPVEDGSVDKPELDIEPTIGKVDSRYVNNRKRVPPGQYERDTLKDMGGRAGPIDWKNYTLKIHGEVEKALVIPWSQLIDLPQTEVTCDVHCVTKWSLLDTVWQGVQVSELARMAGVKDEARHVIFEAHAGYTANVPMEDAMKDNVLVAHRFNGNLLRHLHGAPVRSLVPDLYFWKSAKWLTGIRFTVFDEPGYWERGIYHNHGDPWKEERFN